MAIDHIVDQISTVLGLLIYHFFDLITNVRLPESSLLKAIIFSLFLLPLINLPDEVDISGLLLVPVDELGSETSSRLEFWLKELTLGEVAVPLLLLLLILELWLVWEFAEDAVEYAVDVGSLSFAYGLNDPLVGFSYGDCWSEGGLNGLWSTVSAKYPEFVVTGVPLFDEKLPDLGDERYPDANK